MPPQLTALMAISSVSLFAILILFSLYREPSGRSAKRAAWLEKAFLPPVRGGASWAQLALVSCLGLFLEMLVIRWVSSEVRVFAYFKNFVLIACFLGFGLGCYLSKRRVNVVGLILPLCLLTVAVKLPWAPLRDMMSLLPQLLGSTSDVHMWGVPSLPVNSTSFLGLAFAAAVIVPMFALIAFAFMPIGQLVGWHLENSGNGIRSYSVNVAASLAGISLYTLLCFVNQPPWVWFLGSALMAAVLFRAAPKHATVVLAGFLFCTAMVSIGPGGASKTYWSPYQKLTITPTTTENGEVIAYELNTNDSWYQRILNLSPQFAAAHADLFRAVPLAWNTYNLPYHFYPNPPSVLVLGAGMGNDTAAALRNGAGHVVSVEIDPLIASLGKELHFEKPYQSDRVRLVVDDARSYIQNSKDSFDLIAFSLLDSHTTSSYFSNIRIDNYVYTIEALNAAKKLLKPDGVFIVKFQVETPWIGGRLQGLLRDVFGREPVRLSAKKGFSTEGSFFITGNQDRIQKALQDPDLRKFVADVPTTPATLTTDDWPYFYQHEPGLPGSVIVISVILTLLCWLMLRETGDAGIVIHWHFFFLGAGFLLLEAQIISKLALLFGTTWMVNSIVVSTLMLLILGSNALVGRWPAIPVQAAYAGIFATIALSYFLPVRALLFESMWLKAVVAVALLCSPVFFAGIVFIRSFAQAGFQGEALGANLLGALVGGLLESLSLWTGTRSLLVIAFLLYAGSYVALRSRSRVASSDLAAAR
jgi:spermidine synthase